MIILFGAKIGMSTSRHTQADGAFEITNLMIENNIRCYCSNYQDERDEILPSAELNCVILENFKAQCNQLTDYVMRIYIFTMFPLGVETQPMVSFT